MRCDDIQPTAARGLLVGDLGSFVGDLEVEDVSVGRDELGSEQGILEGRLGQHSAGQPEGGRVGDGGFPGRQLSDVDLLFGVALAISSSSSTVELQRIQSAEKCCCRRGRIWRCCWGCP